MTFSPPCDVVIVDGDAHPLDSLGTWLAAQGYQACTADATAPLVTIRMCKPYLVLLDAELAAQDNYGLCRALQASETTGSITVVVCGQTAHLAPAALQAGAIDYLLPPWDDAEVQVRLRSHLKRAQRYQQLCQHNAALLQEIRRRPPSSPVLESAEAHYPSIFEHATAGIFRIAPEGGYLDVNPAMAKMFGYVNPDAMVAMVDDVGRQVYIQPKRRDELLVYIDRFDKITDSESEVCRQDGTTFWVSEDIWRVRDATGELLYYEGIAHDISERRQMETELRQQRQQADRLLINILPYQIAQRLKLGTRTIAESLDQVSVLFADLVDFTAASSVMTPSQLVALLNEIFSTFDQLAEFHGLEKIKTIGDAYMVAGGLPTPQPGHNAAIAQFALDIREAIQQFPRPDGRPFELRVGINTGPVVAGVIGRRKFAYDLWGDTVNIASRMEATGEPQRIQITPEVYREIKTKFQIEARGHVVVKGRGQMRTYWLNGPL